MSYTKLPFTGKFEVLCTYGQKGTLWKKGIHQGIDLRAENKNVYCICKGIVERTEYDYGGFGNYVRIKEENSEKRIYLCHLEKIYVKKEEVVTYTTIVGKMGNTGNSTTPHVHIEIRLFENGRVREVLDPAKYMGIENKKGIYFSKDFIINEEVNNIKKVCNCYKLNLRTSPEYADNIYEVVNQGIEVEYLGELNGWAKIKYKNKILYCGIKYLK